MNRDETDRRTPTAIDLDAQHGLMRIVWADSHDDALVSYVLLRTLCPCDVCTAMRIGR